MKKQLLTSSLLLMLAFFTGSSVFAQTQVCGTVYLELYDSYGDGWNGNEIDVKFTGGDSTYTLSSGSFISIPLSVNYLDTAEFVWQNGGSYTSECTYKVTDAAGTVLYSSPTGNNMTIGSTQYTAYCATPPVPQMCGTVYLELYDSYGDGWNGNEIDVSFTGGDSTFTMSSGSFVSYALTIPYQDTAHFIWQNGGSYTSECTYKVTDAYGTVLYSSPTGNNMTIGATQYSLQCNSLASCIAPTNLSVTTGSTDAALSFDGTSSYAYHLVEYDTAGFAPGTGDTMWVYADTAYITGLMPATSYDFYVTTLCSASDSSAATASLGQFTQCAALATPYSENFDASTTGSAFNPSLPQCWDFYNGYTGTFYYPYVYNRNYSFYANSGSNFLYAYRSSSSSTQPYYTDTAMVIMPEIQGLDSATKQLKFHARTTSVGRPGEVIIGLTDAAGTPSSLKIVDTVYAPTTTYSQYTVYLDGATTGDARVALVFMRQIGTYDYVCIDDVEISDIPPCPEPIGLSLASATRTSATINWSSSSAAFDIEVGPMGFTQGTGTSYTSTTNSVTATNLMQNTYYDAYVRSNCTSSGDGTSSYVGPFTFKTECGWFASPYSADFSYKKSFGSYTNPDLPDCWSNENLSDYLYNYAYVTYSSFSGNQATDSAYMYFRTYYSQFNSQTALGDTNVVLLPMMTDLTNNDQQILFNARAGSTSAAYNAKVAVGTVDSTGDLSTLSIIDTVEFIGTAYADYSLDLDNVPANGARVALVAFAMANTGYTYGYNMSYIDRVEIRQAPQCPEVYDVVATATSDSSAVITWGDSSVVDEYLIDWGLAGFTQGTGVYDTIVGTTWSNNMLTAGETYEFYFQSVCSAMGVNSPWYGPVTLEVPCAPTSVPFADGFENKPTSYGNSSNPNLPDCWTYSVNANPGFSYSYGSTSTWSSYSGSGYLYNRQSNVAGDTVVVSLPMIENLDTDGAVLKFWARVSSTFYQGQMAVATSGVTGDYKTATVAQNMNLTNNTYQQFSVYLDSNVVPAGAQRPAFLFYSIAGSYNYIYLDSVEVEALPACVAYNFAESNVTDSSADLSWSFTGNNSFNLEYGPTGFIQGTGTGAQAGTTVSSVSAPYSLTGLNPNTTYDYYVESACNPGTWYGPFTFTTECTGPLAAGTYTVGATGDFATLDSVMSTLNVCGIGGAVTFEFQAGSFIASQPIGEINGSSATNTITFKGGSAADTITAGGDAAFVLEGAKHMVFEDLYIYAPGSKGFRLNGTEDVTIDGNTIEIGATTSSLANGIVASASSTSIYSTTTGEKDLTITDNHVDGGYFAIRLYGSSAGRNENVEISGNIVENTYYYGIYVYYGTDVTISDNHLSGFGSSFAYGIYPYQVDGAVISLNHVSDCYYGVYAYYLSSTSAATQSSEISNNMFDAGYYGLSVLYGDSVGVYHNTARGGYAGVRDYYNGTSVNFRNNIFVGGTYALYNYNTNAFGDYNLYHSTGTYLGYSYVSSPYALTYIDSLGELQSLDSTMHMSSVEGDPIFAGATDLHVFGPLANDAGDNTVGITVDIDGDTRPMSGSTVVDMGADEYDVIGDDASLTMLVSPTSGVCGDDSLMVSVEIGNFGQNTLTSLTVSADVLGQTLSATPTGLSIPFGGKDTIMLGYVSNYVGGPMSVVAYTQLTNDGRPNNDTLSTSVDIADAQQVSPVYPDFVCSGDDVDLSVTIPTMGKVMWASGSDTIAIVDADSTITIPGLTMDTTITVSAVNYTDSVGQKTPGSGYSYTGAYGMSFTAYSAMSLDSVTLFPNAAGTSNIVIEDASTGTQLYNIAVTTTATGYSAEQVFLGASLGTGSYKIWLNGTTTGGLYDNLGATYPYYSTDSNVVITGDRNGGSSWYEYFYDWKVTMGGCNRRDSTFTVAIHPDPVAMISVDTANATISATDWTASWSTSGTMNADSISVEFSNGTTSTDTAGTVTFTANNAGETVTVIAYGPCSSDTATFTFDVNQISVDEDFMNGSLSIYPNPTRGLFNVEFATEQSKDVEISIVNMVGQVISTDVVEVNGVYNNQFDLSNESAGVYFITFTTDEGTLTERITVE